MLYLTVLLFVHPGQEDACGQYEEKVLQLLPKFNGKLLYRIRPEAATFADLAEELPYEVHVLTFPAKADFEAFRQDPERQALVPLAQQAIRKVLIIEGQLL